MIQSFAMVALGGAVGAMLRFAVGLSVAFPFGTLTVNVLGSFLIGLLWFSQLDRGSVLFPLLMVGVLGGFTTFSTFSLDALKLLEDGRLGAAIGYAMATVLLSLAACGAAFWLMRSAPV
ncbi:MAG: fluoride efflux transporter CrcB [Pseudomonadota bacterium]